MKKSTKRMIVTAILLLVVGFSAYAFGWTQGETFDPSSTYTAPARVSEIDDSTGWVTLVDWAGEAWCIRGEGYEVDQLIIVTFNNNNTETIYDDLIVEVDCLADIEEVG